jgi:hypothetical protein
LWLHQSKNGLDRHGGIGGRPATPEHIHAGLGGFGFRGDHDRLDAGGVVKGESCASCQDQPHARNEERSQGQVTHDGIPLDDANRLYIGMCGGAGRVINKKSSIQWKKCHSGLALSKPFN